MDNSIEEIENSFLEGINPKIKQKIELLRLDKNFNNKVESLRQKWPILIKNLADGFDKIMEFMDTDHTTVKDGQLIIPPPTSDQIAAGKSSADEIFKSLTNKEFDNDIIELTKEARLYPIIFWKEAIKNYVLTGLLFPMSYYLQMELGNSLSKDEIFKVPENLNFAPSIKINDTTKEPELFIQIFETTSLQDIKNNWNIIANCQKSLRENKNIKRYYPLKNIGNAEKLLDIDKFSSYIDPDGSDAEVYSELAKAKKIFGKISNNGKAKQQAKNKVKQLRHQYKKRLT
jgi:hypothetical protein